MKDFLWPCPFCDSEDIALAVDLESETMTNLLLGVGCNACKAKGPVISIDTQEHINECIKKWNNRRK